MTPNMIIKGILSIFLFDFDNNNFLILKSQFLDWNPIYNMHRIAILVFITLVIFMKRNSSLIYVLFACIISQHFVLFLTYASSRYAYLAWLLTFIVFMYLIAKLNLKTLYKNAS